MLVKDRLFPSRKALSYFQKNSVSKKYIFLFLLRKKFTCLRCFSKGVHFPSLHGGWKKGVVKDCTLEEKNIFSQVWKFPKIFFGKVVNFHFKTFIATIQAAQILLKICKHWNKGVEKTTFAMRVYFVGKTPLKTGKEETGWNRESFLAEQVHWSFVFFTCCGQIDGGEKRTFDEKRVPHGKSYFLLPTRGKKNICCCSRWFYLKDQQKKIEFCTEINVLQHCVVR